MSGYISGYISWYISPVKQMAYCFASVMSLECYITVYCIIIYETWLHYSAAVMSLVHLFKACTYDITIMIPYEHLIWYYIIGISIISRCSVISWFVLMVMDIIGSLNFISYYMIHYMVGDGSPWSLVLKIQVCLNILRLWKYMLRHQLASNYIYMYVCMYVCIYIAYNFINFHSHHCSGLTNTELANF